MHWIATYGWGSPFEIDEIKIITKKNLPKNALFLVINIVFCLNLS
jgi:hypothetical protein